MNAAAYVEPVAGAEEFGRWLSERMDEVPVSQAALARKADVNQSLISRYRSGVTVPDPVTIRKLADALDADYEAMMVVAGHLPGDETRASRTFIIRTEDPKVHQLIRLAADVGEEVSPADRAQIEAILKTFRRRPRT